MRYKTNIFISIIAMIMCIPTIMGQTHYRPRVAIGAKAGASLSHVFFNPSVKQDMALGATAGFTFRYIEESHFGLIAELNWEQRGWKENFDNAPYNYKRTINYLQIPVLTHIYFGHRGQFFFNAGPEIGFKIGESTSSNFDIANASILPAFPATKLNTEEMKMPVHQKVDFGISAGIGGEFYLNPLQSIYLETRFYYGIGNVLESGRQHPFAGSNSMSVMITAGYWFRIK